MAVTGPERLAMHAAARGALGPEEGDTLMASLPPANTDIATRQDVERIVERAVDRSESRLQDRIWRVAIGTGVVLYVATVGTVAAVVAVLLQIVDRA